MSYTNKQLESYLNKAREVGKEFTEAVKGVEADKRLSQHGKKEEKQKLEAEKKAQQKELYSQYQQATKKKRNELYQDAFAINGSQSEQLAFDNTVHELSSKDVTSEERQTRLKTGSDITAMAVGKASFDAGDGETLEAFAQQKPHKADAINRLYAFDDTYGKSKSTERKMVENQAFNAGRA